MSRGTWTVFWNQNVRSLQIVSSSMQGRPQTRRFESMNPSALNKYQFASVWIHALALWSDIRRLEVPFPILVRLGGVKKKWYLFPGRIQPGRSQNSGNNYNCFKNCQVKQVRRLRKKTTASLEIRICFKAVLSIIRPKNLKFYLNKVFYNELRYWFSFTGITIFFCFEPKIEIFIRMFFIFEQGFIQRESVILKEI